ncbi:GNAT family N-acetyltransferase, partial [Niallia circulans]
MEISQLHPDDAEAYFALRLEALQINPEAFGSSYEEEKDYPLSRTQSRLSDPASYVYGAFVEKDLVGVVTLMRETKIKMSHRANIYAVYVTPKRRGKGVAKQLLKATIEKSRDIQGIEQVYLAVVAENTAAKKVYRAFGFETYGIDRKAIKIN